jgi:hypothetical protein
MVRWFGPKGEESESGDSKSGDSESGDSAKSGDK